MTVGRLSGQGSRTAQDRLRRAIDDAVGTLAAAGIDTPRVDAELLAAHVTGVPRSRLLGLADAGAAVLARYRELVEWSFGRLGRSRCGPICGRNRPSRAATH